MVMANRQPSKKAPFHFDGPNLDDCEIYSYLSTSTNSNGYLILTMETLFKKAMKASYILLGSVNKHYKCSVHMLLEPFVKRIAPIMFYIERGIRNSTAAKELICI